jgi:hypothetical protein
MAFLPSPPHRYTSPQGPNSTHLCHINIWAKFRSAFIGGDDENTRRPTSHWSNLRWLSHHHFPLLDPWLELKMEKVGVLSVQGPQTEKYSGTFWRKTAHSRRHFVCPEQILGVCFFSPFKRCVGGVEIPCIVMCSADVRRRWGGALTASWKN